MKKKLVKRFCVTVSGDIVGGDIERYMSGFICKKCVYTVHSNKSYRGCNYHYHIYVELVVPIDLFVLTDYFGPGIDIPRSKVNDLFVYLTHCGLYKVQVLDYAKSEAYRDEK